MGRYFALRLRFRISSVGRAILCIIIVPETRSKLSLSASRGVKMMTVVTKRQRMSFEIILPVRNTSNAKWWHAGKWRYKSTHSLTLTVHEGERWAWHSGHLVQAAEPGAYVNCVFQVSFFFLVDISQMKPWKCFANIRGEIIHELS